MFNFIIFTVTCEKLQEQLTSRCAALPPNEDRQQIDLLIVELVSGCPSQLVTHTSRILNSGRDDETIPDFLRKKPEAKGILIKYGLLEESPV